MAKATASITIRTSPEKSSKPINYRAIDFNIGGRRVQIAGMASPSSKEQDPKAVMNFLKGQGYTMLISLDEHINHAKIAEAAGITYVNQNVKDFTAPSIEQLEHIYALIKDCVARGGKPVIHCMEGFGRTGTVLAAIKLKELQATTPLVEWSEQVKSSNIQLGHYGGNKSVLCTPMVKQAIELVRACQGSVNSVENQLQVDQLCDYEQELMLKK